MSAMPAITVAMPRIWWRVRRSRPNSSPQASCSGALRSAVVDENLLVGAVKWWVAVV
jgi:hypothetical protein